MTASDIRAEARKKLTNKWGKAALITLVVSVITYIISFILNLVPLVGYIVSVVVSVPLSYGFIVSMMKLNDDTEVGVLDFISNGFSRFGKAWSVTLWTMLKLIVPVILVIISIIITMGVSIYASASSVISGASSGSTLLTPLCYILCLATSIYAIIKQLSYRLAFYILTDHPDMTGKEAVNKSAELMKGNIWSLFYLNLTFLGWAILAVLTLGIGMLWLSPYIQISEINFYRNLIENETTQGNSSDNSEEE